MYACNPNAVLVFQRDVRKWLPSFIIVWVLFDVVIICIYGILVFASLYDAFGEFGALVF